MGRHSSSHAGTVPLYLHLFNHLLLPLGIGHKNHQDHQKRARVSFCIDLFPESLSAHTCRVATGSGILDALPGDASVLESTGCHAGECNRGFKYGAAHSRHAAGSTKAARAMRIWPRGMEIILA